MTWIGKLYVWATYRLYDELAWAYDPVSWLVSLGRWSRWRLLALDQVSGNRVLEMGFGTGELLLEMSGRGLDPVGLDVSPAMQRVTARKLARRGLEVPRLRGLTQAMPFPDECFDSVVSTFPAGYILDPRTLHEAVRILCRPDPSTGKAGGRLVVVGLEVSIEVPAWRKVMRMLFGMQDRTVLAQFTDLATAAGLHVHVLEQGSDRVRVPVVIAER